MIEIMEQRMTNFIWVGKEKHVRWPLMTKAAYNGELNLNILGAYKKVLQIKHLLGLSGTRSHQIGFLFLRYALTTQSIIRSLVFWE